MANGRLLFLALNACMHVANYITSLLCNFVLVVVVTRLFTVMTVSQLDVWSAAIYGINIQRDYITLYRYR